VAASRTEAANRDSQTVKAANPDRDNPVRDNPVRVAVRNLANSPRVGRASPAEKSAGPKRRECGQ
jgi:hypothetical protein